MKAREEWGGRGRGGCSEISLADKDRASGTAAVGGGGGGTGAGGGGQNTRAKNLVNNTHFLFPLGLLLLF